MIMNINNLIDKHKKAIELLEGIKGLEKRKELTIDSLNGFAGTFPELRRKYLNRIDTLSKCIDKLTLKYQIILNPVQ